MTTAANRRLYKSESKPWAAGSHVNFADFVHAKRDGLRTMIRGFWVVCSYADINIATTAIQGEDLARSFKRVEIHQVGGRKRWNLRGDESRVMAYLLDGADRYTENADSATTTDQVIRVAQYIPMEKRYFKRGRDFALPAELLEQVYIECADLSELGVSGGTVTIDSASYYVVADTYLSSAIELAAEDEVSATLFAGTGGGRVNVNGRIAALALHARGASGGAAMTNMTACRIEEVIPKALTRQDLVSAYRRDRGAVANLNSTIGGELRSDPLAVNAAVPVLWTLPESSVTDGYLADQIQVELTNSVASVSALHHVVKPHSEEVAQAVARRHGVGNFRVKTASKSKRSPSDWGSEDLQFLPLTGKLTR